MKIMVQLFISHYLPSKKGDSKAGSVADVVPVSSQGTGRQHATPLATRQPLRPQRKLTVILQARAERDLVACLSLILWN